MMNTSDVIIVGCGYAADFYVSNIRSYKNLNIVGCVDRDVERLRTFSSHYAFDSYSSLSEALEAKNADIIINITNPEEHADVSLEALEMGVSVYSEKPLTLSTRESLKLMHIADQNKCIITSAPSLLLNPPFIKVVELLRAGLIGDIKIIKSAIHEGPVHQMRFDKWISCSGAPWPAKNEFEVGCGFEHGSYVLDMVLALMGTPNNLKYSSALIYPQKVVTESPAIDWMDITLEYPDSRKAKIELSIVESEDHSFRIIGDKGELIIEDVWMANSPIILKYSPKGGVARPSQHFSLCTTVHPQTIERRYEDTHFIDQAAGIWDLAVSMHFELPPLLNIRRSIESINVIETVVNKKVYQPATTSSETLLDIEQFEARIRRFFL
jgi:predicted dehydrogenase